MIQQKQPKLRLLDRVIDMRSPSAGMARFQRWHACRGEQIAVIRYPGIRQSAYVPISSLLYVQKSGQLVPCEEVRRPGLVRKRILDQKKQERRRYLREYLRDYRQRRQAGLPTYRRTRRADPAVTAPAATKPRISQPAGVPWLKWLFMDADHEPSPQEQRIAEIFVSEYAALQRRRRVIPDYIDPDQDRFEDDDAA